MQTNSCFISVDNNRQMKFHLGCFLSSIFLAINLLILSFTPQTAQAGPPFVTDDPEPVEYQHYELYLAAQYKHDQDQNSSTLPHLEINYGILPNMQIHVIAPFLYVKKERVCTIWLWRHGTGS